MKKVSMTGRDGREIIIPHVQSVSAPSITCLCFKVVETAEDGKNAIVTYVNGDEFKYLRVEEE